MNIHWTLVRNVSKEHTTWVAYYKGMVCPIDASHPEWLTRRGRALARRLAKNAFKSGCRT
jgi:hypothetical protein